MTETPQDLHRAFLGALRRVSPSTAELMDKSQIHVSKPPASPVVLKDHASIFIYPAGNGKFRKFTASAHTYTDTGPHWENTQSFDTVEEALANLSGLLGTPDALLTRIAELKEALAVAESRVAELEQQNAKKDAVLAKITRMVDLAEKANDERTEMEVALSASFDEAIAHQMLEIEEAKVSTLERQNAELSAACKAKTSAILQAINCLDTDKDLTDAECERCHPQVRSRRHALRHCEAALALTPSDALKEYREKVIQLFNRSQCDPGQFTPRGDDHQEALGSWQQRAWAIALAQLGEKV